MVIQGDVWATAEWYKHCVWLESRLPDPQRPCVYLLGVEYNDALYTREGRRRFTRNAIAALRASDVVYNIGRMRFLGY